MRSFFPLSLFPSTPYSPLQKRRGSSPADLFFWPLDFWSSKQSSFVSQTGLLYEKKDHIMNLVRYFFEKAKVFLSERESPLCLIIIQ